MKKNLIAGLLAAVLAFAGVACSSDGGDTGGDTATEPAATEATS